MKAASRATAAVIGVAIAVLAWRNARWEREFRVQGASMAPAWIGTHAVLRCPRCEFPWRCPVECLPQDDRATCPNCRRTFAASADALQSGDHGRLVRPCRIRRNDLIAVWRKPDEQAHLKRVVGLPSEEIGVRRGDLLVHGRVHRKTWSQFQQVAVLVHDDRFGLPDAGGWRPVLSASAWRRTGSPGDLLWSKPGRSPTPREDRLIFRPHGFGPNSRDEWTDAYAENQSASRALEAVRDIVLSCRVRSDRGARLQWRLSTSFWSAECDWDRSSGDLRLRATEFRGETQWTRELKRTLAPGVRASRRVAFGVWDRRAAVVIDDVVALEVTLDSLAQDKASVAIPKPQATLIADARWVEFRELTLFRDLHYLPRYPGQAWTLQLGPNQFGVLGDNVPYAIDSRRYGGVARWMLLGRAASRGRQPR